MRADARVSLIAAVAANGVIGDGPRIPWRLSSDLRRFRRLTLGKPVIMGRRTFESLPAPLADRHNLVLSRSDGEMAGAEVLATLGDAVARAAELAAADPEPEIMVIGGGQVYAATIACADRLYITHVDARPAGDIRFPEIDPAVWVALHQEEVPPGPKDEAASRFVVYGRRQPGGEG